MPTPSYLTDDPKRDRIKKSRKQERLLAKRTGGRAIRGSGAGREKGDVNINRVRFKIEAKRTDSDSISIKKAWLTKITEEAFSVGRRPALAVEINGEKWVAIQENEFLDYLNYCEARDNSQLQD